MAFFSNVLINKTRLGLASQLLLGLVILSGLYTVVSAAVQVWSEYRHSMERSNAVLESIPAYYLPKIKRSLVADDQYQLTLITEDLYQLSEVHSVAILRNSLQVVRFGPPAPTGGTDAPAPHLWTVLTENYAGETSRYALEVRLSPDTQWVFDATHLRQMVALQGLCALLFALGFYALVRRLVLAPVNKIARRVGAIGADNQLMPLKLPERPFDDEVEQFTQRYNESAERIRNTCQSLSSRCLAAEEARKRKSESMATVSREIRTSLNSMYGLITLLRENPSARDLTEYASLLHTSAAGLQDLVNDIHDLSQIEIGELALSNSRLDIAEMIAEIDATFRPRATEKDLLFQCTADASISHFLLGDRTRLRQILRNLVSNAIKFTHNGYVLLDVQHLAYDDSSETILFEVKDSGIGVDRSQQETLFDSTLRTESADLHQEHGTGLRLGISRQLVRLMGGELALDSEPGLGCHFYFTLRFETQAASEEPAVTSFSGSRVLLVDDSQFNNRITSLQLHKMDLSVECTEDETQVMSLLWNAVRDQQPFRLVLLDKNMPRISGTELAQKIVHELADKAPPVLMISAEELNRDELARYGIKGYLMRPYRTEELEHHVRKLLSGAGHTDNVPEYQVPESQGRAELKILLVEDQVSNQVVMKKMLQRLGVSVTVAENGRIAVSRCAVEHYDLVFMDCQMPVMDGFEATLAIRKLEAGSALRVPIVALTANVLAEEKSRCFEVGMDGFVSKPVNFSKLSHTLRSHIPSFEFVVEESQVPFFSGQNQP